VRGLATAPAPVEALRVLDKAELLVDRVADLAVALLAKAPGLRLFVTSQAALKIDGERVFRHNELAVPDAGTPLSEAQTCGAVALFAEDASAANRRSALDAANVDTVPGAARSSSASTRVWRCRCLPSPATAGGVPAPGPRWPA